MQSRNSKDLRSLCPLVFTAVTGKKSVFFLLMKDMITHRVNYTNVFLLSAVLLLGINHASLVKCIKYSTGKYYWEGDRQISSVGYISFILSTSLGILHRGNENIGLISLYSRVVNH